MQQVREIKDKSSASSLIPWIILFMFLGTMIFFFALILQSVPINPTKSSLAKNTSSSPPSSDPKILLLNNNPISHEDLMNLLKKSIRSYLDTLTTSFDIHNQNVIVGGHTHPKSIQVHTEGFFIYDVNIIYDSSQESFIVNVLMELPKINILFEDPAYNQFYPEINPYVHAAEFVFRMNTTELILLKTELYMVDWIVNRYNTLYQHTKNSPVCIPSMPPPLNISKSDVSHILTAINFMSQLSVPKEFDLSMKTSASSPIVHKTEIPMQD